MVEAFLYLHLFYPIHLTFILLNKKGLSMTASQSPRPDAPSSSTPLDNEYSVQESTPIYNDSPKQLFGVYAKGIAMGAADIVPGVSGGTIALIAGIYERLINALSSVGPHLWQIFRQQGGLKGLVAVCKQVDATFLVCLLLGIATSFATLAGVIDRKSTRLNSCHVKISYAVFC